MPFRPLFLSLLSFKKVKIIVARNISKKIAVIALVQKRVVLKDIGNNVNMETFVEDTIKIKAVNSGIFKIIKKLTIC